MTILAVAYLVFWIIFHTMWVVGRANSAVGGLTALVLNSMGLILAVWAVAEAA